MRSRSVVPPIPSEVCSDKEVPGFSWTPSPGSAATSLGFSMRMMFVCRVFGPEKDHEFVAGAADVSSADSHDGVAGAGFVEQELDSSLHGAVVVDVLVAGFANGVGQGFAGDAGNGGFARGVNVQQHQDVGLIEGAAEFFPEVLRAREAVRLEKHQEAVELAAASGFECGANFDWVMTVVVDHGDVVDDALDVEAAADAGKFGEAF